MSETDRTWCFEDPKGAAAKIDQLEWELEGEQQLKAAHIKNIAELNNDVAELRTKIEHLERELEETTAALKKQLQNYSDIVAEIERLNSVDHYACALCPDVAQARQEAAKWVADLLFSPEWEKECHCCEDYYCSICRIKDEFKLEG